MGYPACQEYFRGIITHRNYVVSAFFRLGNEKMLICIARVFGCLAIGTPRGQRLD